MAESGRVGDEYDVGACVEMANLRRSMDFKGITKHLWMSCLECNAAKAALRPKREEIFINGPPSWIAAESTVIDDEPSDETVVSKKRRIEKGPIKVLAISKEDVDNYLIEMAKNPMTSDRALLHEIERRKGVDKVAARELLIALRKAHKAERQERAKETNVYDPKIIGKVRNERTEMPWAPAFSYIFPQGVQSVLDTEDQKRYTSMLSSLMHTGTFRFAINKQEVKDYEGQTEAEYNAFNEKTSELFDHVCKDKDLYPGGPPLTFAPNPMWKRVAVRLGARWKQDASTFHVKGGKAVPWSNNDSVPRQDVPALALKEVLAQGRPDNFELPVVTKKCLTSKVSALPYPSAENSQFPIEVDENAIEMCLEHGIEVAMDSTTACHLLTDPFPGISYNYTVPVSVVERTTRGSLQRVVLLGKPCAMGFVEPMSVFRANLKELAKGTFVSSSRSLPLSNSVSSISTSAKEPTEASSIDENSGKLNETDESDPLSRILSGTSVASSTNVGSSHTKTGKRYSIFSLLDRSILIRGSAPLRGAGHPPASFQPVHELIPHAGAMILGKEERFWNYCKQLFKQSEQHYLLRMMPYCRAAHIVQCHPLIDATACSPTDTPQHLKNMLNARAGRLNDLLDMLCNISVGLHMIVNARDGQLHVIPSVDESLNGKDYMKTSTMRGKVVMRAGDRTFSDVFHGVERRVVLQWQLLRHRAPGCFMPFMPELLEKGSSEGNRGRGTRGRGRGADGGRGRGRGRGDSRGRRGSRGNGRQRGGRADGGEYSDMDTPSGSAVGTPLGTPLASPIRSYD